MENNRLVLKINERIHEWEIEPKGNALENIIISIADILRPLNNELRDKLLEEIMEWSGIPSYHENEARCMTADELSLLGDNDLIEIGSHSISHPLLNQLSYSDRQYEIIESKRILEEITSKPVSGFSFPNGRYVDSDIELVQQSGYHYACISRNGTIRKESNLYTLPRFWAGDIDGDSFYKWLKLWM
jgi:peptidoglycan/xylan/chitin deacetylase (PgdA/CDA1 family)